MKIGEELIFVLKEFAIVILVITNNKKRKFNFGVIEKHKVFFAPVT